MLQHKGKLDEKAINNILSQSYEYGKVYVLPEHLGNVTQILFYY